MSMARSIVLGAALAVPMLAVPLAAQAPAGGGSVLGALKWRSIGPANMVGRVSDVEGVPGDPNVMYVGGADGGVWKTTNGGTTYEEIWTTADVYSVGDITVAPSNHDVIWLGSGEGDPRNSTSFGNGVYRSTDGGKSWTHLGLADSERIKRVRVHPGNPDIAWVCALGHAWGPNEERGVFKTTDGGRSWRKVLYRDPDTGCSDLDVDASNPQVMYAGMWTYRRQPWRFDSGGGETALYKTTDGGESWQKLTNGLPKGPMDRIGVAIAPSRPNTVYMITESRDEGGLFRSDDAGASWTRISDDTQLTFRPFYYSDIRVDPKNPERLYALAGGLSRSTDGGKTWQRIGQGLHSDHQAMWIDPQNPMRILEGSDGGFQVSFDGGDTWRMHDQIALSQFYQIFHDDQNPYMVCGGLQDNGNWCGPSANLAGSGILNDHWFTISGGDGFWAVPVPGKPHLVYTTSHGGNVQLTDTRTGLNRSIIPYPKDFGAFGGPIADSRFRYNWDSPVIVSPHDPNVVYFGANVLFRSTNEGQSWEQISPDLTDNDKSKQQSSGGPVAQDNTSAEFHNTILAIAESPLRPGVIWVGTDDGNVQLTQDGGKTWTNVTGPVIEQAGKNPWIPHIDASHHDPGTAYVAVDRHRYDDFRPYAYYTTDYGKTWVDISAGLPRLGYVNVIREDPKNPNLLYAGTENGLYASWDKGKTWQSIRGNVPPVSVRDLKVHPRENDLIIGTHGRGAWILDDITPLQQLAQAGGADAHLFPVKPAERWQTWNNQEYYGQTNFEGENPSFGAVINFHLRSPTPVTFAVADASGQVIREWTEQRTVAGLNRVEWDLRHRPALASQGDQGGGRRFGGGGPIVSPGRYTLTMTVNGRALSTPVEVLPDPRMPDADYRTAERVALELRSMVEQANRSIDQMESLKTQLTTLAGSLDQPAYASVNRRTLSSAVDAALTEVTALRARMTRMGRQGYREPPRIRDDINQLMGAVGRAPAPPTAGQLQRMEELKGELAQVEADLARFLSGRIAEINTGLRGTGTITVGNRE